MGFYFDHRNRLVREDTDNIAISAEAIEDFTETLSDAGCKPTNGLYDTVRYCLLNRPEPSRGRRGRFGAGIEQFRRL